MQRCELDFMIHLGYAVILWLPLSAGPGVQQEWAESGLPVAEREQVKAKRRSCR